MPSLTTLTGRPAPTAWPDPAAMAEQPKSSDIRRTQWPFMVQGEEIIPCHQPRANGTVDAAAKPMQHPAHEAVPGRSASAAPLAAGSVTSTSINVGAVTPTGVIDGRKLAAGALKANEIARRICDTKSEGSIDTARLVHDTVTDTSISAKTLEANTVNALFPGALHANSVTAAWAMSNGLGHLVRKP